MLHWFCQNCERSALNAVKADNVIEEKCAALFADFKKEIEEAFMKQISSLKTELAEVKQKAGSHSQEGAEGKVVGQERREVGGSDRADGGERILSELAERERRKANLVWFGVPESQAEEVEERVAADSAFLVDLCDRALGVKLEIVTCKRLRSKDGKVASRPLLVTVKDSVQVGGVLKEARKLRSYEEFKGVYVKKDSTPLERAEMKKLLEERDSKREETKKQAGDENWIIRNGKVVNTTRRHQGDAKSNQPTAASSQDAIAAQ